MVNFIKFRNVVANDTLLFRTLYVMISDHVFSYDFRNYSAITFFVERVEIKNLALELYKKLDYVPCSINDTNIYPPL
jgi:hypothetical protein